MLLDRAWFLRSGEVSLLNLFRAVAVLTSLCFVGSVGRERWM